MSALAEVLAEHRAEMGDGWCSCGIRHADTLDHTHELHLADVLADLVRAKQAEALREAAAWIAESIGYPVQTAMPDHPMPAALWAALVDHVHADRNGSWHGNTLDHEDTEAWLADEAGRDQ